MLEAFLKPYGLNIEGIVPGADDIDIQQGCIGNCMPPLTPNLTDPVTKMLAEIIATLKTIKTGTCTYSAEGFKIDIVFEESKTLNGPNNAPIKSLKFDLVFAQPAEPLKTKIAEKPE